MKDRKDHSPDFTAPDDERPQFSTLPFEKQQEIICDIARERPLHYHYCTTEAISQMKPDSTVSDLLNYIARCIANNYEQEEWTI